MERKSSYHKWIFSPFKMNVAFDHRVGRKGQLKAINKQITKNLWLKTHSSIINELLCSERKGENNKDINLISLNEDPTVTRL
jgi:hypothetical protein